MRGVGTQGAEALWLSTTHPGTQGSEQNFFSCQKTASLARVVDRREELSEVVLPGPELILSPLMVQFGFTIVCS